MLMLTIPKAEEIKPRVTKSNERVIKKPEGPPLCFGKSFGFSRTYGFGVGVIVAAGVLWVVTAGVVTAFELLLTVGARVGISTGISSVGAACWNALDPPPKIKMVPSTMLSATSPFSPNDAYQRQSRFFVLGFALLGILFLSLVEK